VADCLFCDIVAREIPAKQVAESPRTIAFHDRDPQAPVHVLVTRTFSVAGRWAGRQDEARRMRPADTMACMRARVCARAGKGP
jgi:hypothetical protein